MNDIPFTLDATDGGARATTLKLARGEIRTPVYMPVGTQGAIRAVSPLHLEQTGTQILLANTYHLSQRPGEDLVARHGGRGAGSVPSESVYIHDPDGNLLEFMVYGSAS